MKLFNKISKGGKLFKSIIQSKVLLYFLSFLSILNILFFGYSKDFQSVMAFIIIALLMSFFSKNMIIILFVAIVLTNLIKFALHKSLYNEGMENMDEEEDEELKESMEHEGKTNEDKLEDSLEKVLDEDLEEMKKEDDMRAEQVKQQEKEQLYSDLKNDMVEFEELQRSIMNNMKEIDPLLTKAETFVEKFEGYKKKLT